MTRNRFNQAKHKSTSTSTNNLTLSKARGLFLEDNDNINMKNTYKITNVHPPIKTKEEYTLNFRMIKPTEKFNFSEPILNTTKLGLIRLSVYNSVFNVNRRNIQFLYASTVI